MSSAAGEGVSAGLRCSGRSLAAAISARWVKPATTIMCMKSRPVMLSHEEEDGIGALSTRRAVEEVKRREHELNAVPALERPILVPQPALGLRP